VDPAAASSARWQRQASTGWLQLGQCRPDSVE